MRAARGEYILFIDQDDYYHPGAIKKVYEHLREHPGLDVLVSDSAWQFKGHESNKLQLNFPYEGVCTGIEFLQKNGPVISPWRVAFNRAFYASHDIHFEEKCRIEDVDWTFKMFYYAKKMQYLKVLLVHWQRSVASTTYNSYKDLGVLKGSIKAACRLQVVADTLYRNTVAYPIVTDMVESYFYSNCRTLFGSYFPISQKREMIEMIPQKHTHFKLVNFALRHPTLFCVITNLGVIPYRIARYFKRKWQTRG